MTARHSVLSRYDKALLRAEIDRLDRLAAEPPRRQAVAGELIDCAARLRTVLIWAGKRPTN